MANNIKLPPEVAAEFELVDWEGSTRQVFGKYGTVDLKTLTLRKARSLYKRKFKKLRPIQVKKAK